MNGGGALESDFSGYVEVDPTGRYGRYNEVLGKGASKTVFRAFDEYEGIEVAWNQVKLSDFLQRPGDLERLYSEIHLLRTLKHTNIMKFYASWVDTDNRNINFVTELFTSGTLRQYRLKHKKVNIRAIKHWCRQILKGLLYLHSLEPPVIHRDLKCDNIFINGNQGQVKIGDLGLAAILRKSYAAHCVGTPEFMAPEVYEEEYNELVDIYSFGMCVLEMVTFEYPYSECTHPAQIYKKVISGKKPDALYKVKDPEVRRFVEKCLATVSCRLPASELLKDPFLKIDSKGYDLIPVDYQRDNHPCYGSLTNSCSDCVGNELDNDIEYGPEEFKTSELDLFMSPDHDHLSDFDIAIKGKKRGDGHIFLRLRIADKEGRVRNIYFPFDIENDTALSVATEMVAELDMVEQDATKIADMIDEEIASLVPGWKSGISIDEEEEEDTNLDQGRHSTSSQYLADYVSSENPSSANLEVLHCSGHASGRGRFEEITYQMEASHEEPTPESSLNQSDGNHFTDMSAQQDRNPRTPYNSPVRHMKQDDHENRIRKELRWLKAKYQLQLQELRDRQLGAYPDGFGKCKQDAKSSEHKTLSSYLSPGLDESRDSDVEKLLINCGSSSDSDPLINRKNLCNEVLLPHSLLHRTISLPVDAVDC